MPFQSPLSLTIPSSEHVGSVIQTEEERKFATADEKFILGMFKLTEEEGKCGFVLPLDVDNLENSVAVMVKNLGKEKIHLKVHEIRDFSWDEIPDRGASWLREAPIQDIWKRVILVPAFGGLIVSFLNLLSNSNSRPFLKAIAASVTLGTGNSLGPEGPNVDIGNSIAKSIASTPFFTSARILPLLAAGSVAGLAAGFNVAVAGCFFAVESVLWPSDSNSSLSLTNSTSTVILSAVIASVISEIGLGSQPAFQVPDYDFCSPAELPLYLLLDVLCGLVSLTLSWSTSYMFTIFDNLHKVTGMPKASFPILAGLSVGFMALLYPEILYWGFENVDILLESRPFVIGLSTDLLLQLVAVKIVATSLCRASGLVGGYYAPSLFIGGATGMAYGKLIALAVSQSNFVIDLSVLEVASPQAYGLVGMAATLAGVCQVPLTAVLLLFELTQDYRIVLPLLGAVGLSSWISSVQTNRGDERDREKLKLQNSNYSSLPEISSPSSITSSTGNSFAEDVSYLSNSCQVESSSRVEDNNDETVTLVSEAMKTRYVTVSICTPLTKVIDRMLAEKQSCAVIVDTDDTLIGLLTLRDIQEYEKSAKARSKNSKEILVSELCVLNGGICSVPCTATPDMKLHDAQMIVKEHGVDQIPVVRNINERTYPVGLIAYLVVLFTGFKEGHPFCQYSDIRCLSCCSLHWFQGKPAILHGEVVSFQLIRNFFSILRFKFLANNNIEAVLALLTEILIVYRRFDFALYFNYFSF